MSEQKDEAEPSGASAGSEYELGPVPRGTDIVFVCYFEWLKAERLARYSLVMNDR